MPDVLDSLKTEKHVHHLIVSEEVRQARYQLDSVLSIHGVSRRHLNPDLILTLIAADHGIPSNCVQEAIRNSWVYSDPERQDISEPERRRTLLQLLPHVRVLVKAVGQWRTLWYLMLIFPQGSRKGWLPPSVPVEPRRSNSWKKKLETCVKAGSYCQHHFLQGWTICSATRLQRASIGLGRCDMIHQTHLDLSGKPVLRLPILLVSHESDTLLRNLLMLERNKNPLSQTPLASYIKLMDNLIDTAEDVSILRDAGVLFHQLGSDEAVAKMWNELGSNLHHYPSDRWAEMLMLINLITRVKGRLHWLEFKRRYLSRPWLVTGTVTAILIVVTAIIQTIFTAFQVFLTVLL
ncbi:hypothetical protein R1flu_004784 [Riccia fluitans]|uniref:Uncharacterized protein n=1 Tax=Riccia fluitans TaxID=41844 RepID=A0ABD1YRA4_9MARC